MRSRLAQGREPNGPPSHHALVSRWALPLAPTLAPIHPRVTVAAAETLACRPCPSASARARFRPELFRVS